MRTRMANYPGMALLVDTGSPGNLSSDGFGIELAKAAYQAGRAPYQAGRAPPTRKVMNAPLDVGGIGDGTKTARLEVSHNIGLDFAKDAVYTAPKIPKSNIPDYVRSFTTISFTLSDRVDMTLF